MALWLESGALKCFKKNHFETKELKNGTMTCDQSLDHWGSGTTGIQFKALEDKLAEARPGSPISTSYYK